MGKRRNIMRTVEISYYNHSQAGSELIDPALVPRTGNAQPTSRVLEGSSDHGYAQEWAEPAVLTDGRKCERIYLFTADEIVDDAGEPLEAEDYPWDDDHVRRIRLLD
jgi:hypothetical protein